MQYLSKPSLGDPRTSHRFYQKLYGFLADIRASEENEIVAAQHAMVRLPLQR